MKTQSRWNKTSNFQSMSKAQKGIVLGIGIFLTLRSMPIFKSIYIMLDSVPVSSIGVFLISIGISIAFFALAMILSDLEEQLSKNTTMSVLAVSLTLTFSMISGMNVVLFFIR